MAYENVTNVVFMNMEKGNLNGYLKANVANWIYLQNANIVLK